MKHLALTLAGLASLAGLTPAAHGQDSKPPSSPDAVKRVAQIDSGSEKLVIVTHKPAAQVAVGGAGVHSIASNPSAGALVISVEPTTVEVTINSDPYPVSEIPTVHNVEGLANVTATSTDSGIIISNEATDIVVVISQDIKRAVPGGNGNESSPNRRLPGVAIIPPGQRLAVATHESVTIVKLGAATTYRWTSTVTTASGNRSTEPSSRQDGWEPPRPGEASPSPVLPTQTGWTFGPGTGEGFSFRGIGPQAGYSSTLSTVRVHGASMTGTTADSLGNPCDFKLDLTSKTFAMAGGGVSVDLGCLNLQVGGMYGTYHAKGVLTCTGSTFGAMPELGPGPAPIGGGDGLGLPAGGGGLDPLGLGAGPGMISTTTTQVVDIKGTIYGLDVCLACPLVRYTQGPWMASLSASVGMMWVVETIDKVDGHPVRYGSVEEMAWTFGALLSVGYALTANTSISVVGGASRIEGDLQGWSLQAGVAYIIRF